jgi:alkylation response protein AidB-like acyl-CoA dehydrogenase
VAAGPFVRAFRLAYLRAPRAEDDVRLGSAEILENARKLAPEVAARADDIARLRRLPADLVAALKAAGVFRMPMPAAWGGPEMPPRAQNEVIEILSAADASVGWCVMIGSDAGFYAAFLEEAAARRLYPELDLVTAGLIQPAGRALRVPGGYRVSGRWAFGSGCTHADVIVGGCLILDGEEPVLTEAGLPAFRVMLAPAAAFEVIDTWYTTGLAGSGSHDYTTHDLFVPAEHSFDLWEPPRRREPLYAWSGMFFINMHGVALGIARRAIDEVRELAEKKTLVPELVLMRNVPRVRSALARAEGMLGAARAYTYETMDRVWEALQREGRLSHELRLHVSLSRVNAFQTAREVAQLMLDTAGSSSIYASSPLDRLLRDAITVRTHLAVQERLMERVAALAVGEEPDVPFL